MMHTERKSPWIRGEVPGKNTSPRPDQERLRGMSFDEGEKSLAPRPEAPPQPRLPGLSDREKQAIVTSLRNDVGAMQESAALARTVAGAASDFRRQSRSIAGVLRRALPSLTEPAGQLEGAVDALCAVAEAQKDLEPPEELMESYGGARDEYQENQRLRDKYYLSRRDLEEKKEEGDKVGAFFAKKKAKARAKKVRKHQGKVESSRAKFDEAKQALVARLHVAFSGARAALEMAIAQIRTGLEQVGANPPDMGLIGESVEKGLSNALIEMLVPESGIRRPD